MTQFELMTLKVATVWLCAALAVFAICYGIMLSAAARDFLSAAELTYPYIAVWGASALAAPFLLIRVIVLALRRARTKQKWR